MTTAVGLVVTALVGIILWGFFVPASFFSKTALLNDDQALLKKSLGVKAYDKLEVFEFLDKAAPSIAVIYRKKAPAAQVADSLYLEKDRLGYGFVLTADGWVVANKNAIGGLTSKSLAIGIKNFVYNVSSVVYDTWTDAAFLKLNAENLPVVSLGDSGALKLGDIVFSGSNKNNFWFSHISAINIYPDWRSKGDAIISSENFGKIIQTQNSLPSKLNGGMIVNKSGEVAGLIMADNNYIFPVNYFKNVISDLLKNKKISRPYFGANYIDLSFGIAGNLPNSKGAYINSAAVDSPAYKAGLKIGDIVLSIDNENINEYKNLSEFVSEYKAGDEITMKILRAGEEMEIKAAIGSE